MSGPPADMAVSVGAVPALASIADRILSLRGWPALALVFLLPALESSAFVGFVFPGEIAVLLGGVLASYGRVPLWGAIVAGVAGAILGDSVGYVVGKRWGRRLLDRLTGRLIKGEHLDRAEAYLRRRGGAAVFFGRFTAALRVLVPGLAGMSNLPYPTFLAYNAAGGALWAGGFVVLGFVAGASWRRVEHVATQIGLVLLALVVVALGATVLYRQRERHSARLRRLADRMAASRPARFARVRLPRQVAWFGRRLSTAGPGGFALTFAVACAALGAWILGSLWIDVAEHREIALSDPTVTAWVVAHRSAPLTAVLRTVTWAGSWVVLVPIAALAALVLWARRRVWNDALLLAGAFGVMALYGGLKHLEGRPRPPAHLWIGHFTGFAFPSGHAAASAAVYGMIAVLAAARSSGRGARVAWLSAAVVVVLVVGASRVYLAAHWLTDVLAGFGLGIAWCAGVLAVALAAAARSRPARRADGGTLASDASSAAAGGGEEEE